MLGVPELLVLLVLIALLFGAGKLPEVMAAIGKGAKEFQDSVREGEQGDPIDVEAEDVGRRR